MSKKAISGEVQMFGMSEDTIREEYMGSLTAKFSGLEMVVAGILSDCQEELAAGDQNEFRDQDSYEAKRRERIRKQLNVAKFILFEMMDAKRANESKYIGESV
jgi:hypothetical protein